MNPVYQQISDYIDTQHEQMLQDLKEVVIREGHSTERENVERVMDYYCSRLREIGVENIKKYEIADNRAPLIVAMIGEERPGAPILLSGHFDTVHPKGSFGDPACRQEGDRLYGPGAKDCKGGMVITLYILKALQHIGWAERPIKLILVSDEEETHTGSIGDE